MKTEDLIKTLAEHPSPPGLPITGRLVGAAVVGASLSFIVLLATLGTRPGFADALVSDWRLPLKIAFAVALSASGFTLLKIASGPERPLLSAYLPLTAAPALLLAGVVAELLAVPARDWLSAMRGANPSMCVLAIPALAIVPFVVVLVAVREGAPRSPATAGTFAGLAASGQGAAVYALRCPDDSPLFVAVWYLLAIAIVALIGRVIGARLLRW